MPTTTTLTCSLKHIAEVDALASGLRITFRDGSTAFLEASHSGYETLRIHAEQGRGRPAPVGVLLEGGTRVVDLSTAHETSVRFVREDFGNPNLFEVAFWGYSSACCLTREHPEFERVHAALLEAIETGRLVWLANHSEMMEVELDGEPALCWKIMDVRPV